MPGSEPRNTDFYYKAIASVVSTKAMLAVGIVSTTTMRANRVTEMRVTSLVTRHATG